MKINHNIAIENSLAIIGHSHPETSINDSIISHEILKNVKNYSVSGQSMFWSIIGARKLKHQGVKHFIIELTNSTYFTGWKTTDNRGLKDSGKFYFLKPTEIIDLLKKDIIFTSKLILKNPFPKVKVRGKYLKHKKKFSEEVVKENSNSIFIEDFDDSVVHKFIKNNESISFVIIRVPQHPQYYDFIGEKNEMEFIEKLKSFKKYKNCIVMDFGHKYKVDSLFADLGHMNYKGATVFSYFLSDSIMKTPNFK